MTSAISVLILFILVINFMFIIRAVKNSRKDIQDIDENGEIHGGEVLKIEFRHLDNKNIYCNIHALIKCEDNVNREIRVNGLNIAEMPKIGDHIIFKIHVDPNKSIKNSGGMADFFESYIDKKPNSKNIKTALFVEYFHGENENVQN